MDSVLNEVAQQVGPRAAVGIVSPEERSLFQTYQIRAVPTIFVVRNGAVTKNHVGIVSKEELIRDLTQ
jgi:hypothetical protein